MAPSWRRLGAVLDPFLLTGALTCHPKRSTQRHSVNGTCKAQRHNRLRERKGTGQHALNEDGAQGLSRCIAWRPAGQADQLLGRRGTAHSRPSASRSASSWYQSRARQSRCHRSEPQGPRLQSAPKQTTPARNPPRHDNMQQHQLSSTHATWTPLQLAERGLQRLQRLQRVKTKK